MDFNKLFTLLNSNEFSDKLDKTLEQETNITTDEVISIIASNYVKLIKYTKIKQIKDLKFSQDDIFKIYLNGKEYDFDVLISHNNKGLTEAKMEIEALIADNPQIEIKQLAGEIIEILTER